MSAFQVGGRNGRKRSRALAVEGPLESEVIYMKKIFAGLTIAALAFFMVLPTQAAIVTDISDSSTGLSVAGWLIKVVMKNLNNAGIGNVVVTTSSSGSNSFTSADDQSGTSIDTGAANLTSTTGNVANNNVLGEEYESSNGATNTIDNVSDDSDGTATSDDELNNDMDNNNHVDVGNTVDATSDSGSNAVVSGDSLTGSSAKTGATSAITSLTNSFNFNLKSVVRRITSQIPPTAPSGF